MDSLPWLSLANLLSLPNASFVIWHLPSMHLFDNSIIKLSDKKCIDGQVSVKQVCQN